jgi:phosphatidylserine/phosphatidylglycerophosphate/cardiolipin synthase-like enzyme
MSEVVNKTIKFIRRYNLERHLPQVNGFLRALSHNGKQGITEHQISTVLPEIEKEVLSTLIDFFVQLKLLRISGVHIVIDDIDKISSFIDHLSFVFDHNLIQEPEIEKKLLWTPPSGVTIADNNRFDRIDTYIHSLIQKTRRSLIFFAPFYTESGTALLCNSLYPLLKNQDSVKISVISTSLEANDYRNYKAFIRLRKDLGDYYNRVTLYVSEGEYLPLHAKFVISDNKKGLLSSANFTLSGLEKQVEIGLELSEQQSQDLSWLVHELIASGLIKSTKVSCL